MFNGINTLGYDPKMPYRVKSKDEYSNYWFSSSDAHTVEEFNDLLSPANIDKIEEERGACIIYTHFASGFLDDQGTLDSGFQSSIRDLSRRDGWFVPASEVLDFLLERREDSSFVSLRYLTKLDSRWVVDRIGKKLKYGR